MTKAQAWLVLGNLAFALPFIITLVILAVGVDHASKELDKPLPSMADCHGPAECDD